MFNMDKPLAVNASISGNFSGGGDPLLYITADVKDNKLTIPGSTIEDCNFKGVFTNNLIEGKGHGDPNSIIRVFHFTGSYSHVPFTIDTGSITNLVNPIAAGNFRANFPLTDLNYLGSNIARFSNGSAGIALRFKADVVDYRINKPIIGGSINLKNADLNYLPRKLKFKNTSISINVIGDDVIISNIRIQSGRSIVFMQGRVNNFMNLYYNAPERILINWQINSPQLHLGEFLGFLSSREEVASTISKPNSGNILEQFSNVFNKAKANMHVRAANVHYFNFLATDATADLLLSESGIRLSNVSLKTSGGSLKLKGALAQNNSGNHFTINTA